MRWVRVDNGVWPERAESWRACVTSRGVAVRRSCSSTHSPKTTPDPAMQVGPTVGDFADADSRHPLLDADDAGDVTLAAALGTYIA